ncbi:Redoxin [Mycotypha africana]|uniref:Redoxin n=1 Tax=Mycotypha africana TaxID=64632 RepID=UPI002300719E|nr:Redoxin [Mycotypha africana]KAI8982306.1 Redoxin [Mycotypha africana]
MTISVGDQLPTVVLKYAPYDPTRDPRACVLPASYDLAKELKGKKAIIFAIPGAFTPTCSEEHVPTYVKKYDELKKAGVDVIICVAMNDAFVMGAFAVNQNTEDKVIMASEAGTGFFDKLGLTLDLTGAGLGIRSKRFALIVDDLKVTYVGVESDISETKESTAEAILKHL